MEVIDDFYRKFKGSYFAFLGVGVLLTCITIAVFLYSSVDSRFSISRYWISDLGIGPNGSWIVFRFGVIFSCICFIFFFLYLTRYLQNKGSNKALTWLCFLIGVISSIGGVISQSLYPKTPDVGIHEVYAGIFFIGAFLYCIFYGIAELMNSEVPRIQALSGFIAGIFFVVFLALYAPTLSNPGQNIEMARFAQWMALFSLMGWAIVQGTSCIDED